MHLRVPRYIQVRETIRNRVRGAVYAPGARVPSETELMGEFKVSRITAMNALRDLARDGLLVRAQGRGTFVADRVAHQPGPTRRVVGVMIRTEGHLFADLARGLLGRLHGEGFLPTILDAESLLHGGNGLGHLQQLIDGGMDTLILEGVYWLPFPELTELAGRLKRLVFLMRRDTDEAFPGARNVLSDWHGGARQVVEHLLRQGHRRLLHLTYPLAGLPHEVGGELLAGCRAACRAHPEAGQIRLDVAEHRETDPQAVPDLIRRLKAPDRPTAVFASNDFRATLVFEAARQAKLRIPQELAVVGYHDTPWCHLLPVPLSSVNLRVDELTRRTMAALDDTRDGNSDPGPVQPVLIERASSMPSVPLPHPGFARQRTSRKGAANAKENQV